MLERASFDAPPADRIVRALAGRLPVDPAAAVAIAAAHRVPVAALDRFADEPLRQTESWSSAVAADAARADRVGRALTLVADALSGVPGLAVAGDSLGPQWSSDVDVYAADATARDAAAEALTAAGALPLDGLRGRLRPFGRGRGRQFAVVAGNEVLALAEIDPSLGARPVGRAVPGSLPTLQPRDAERRRAAKLATQRATLRGVAELAAMTDPPAAVVRRYAPLAEAFGVAAVLPSPGGPARPSPRRAVARAGTARRAIERRIRPRRVTVAFCGIDGAGKSTQVAHLETHLGRVLVPVETAWTRLGNKASGPVEHAVRLAQRLLPSGTHSYQAVRAQAGRTGAAAPPTPPLTRRGPVGWVYALIVTADYVVRARAAQRRARGRVLILDRALPDALVELADDYGVALDVRFQRRLLERFAPRPDLVLYLSLPGAVAKARKDDVFTAEELQAHVERYEALLQTLPGVAVLDAQQDPDTLALAALRALSVSPFGTPRAAPSGLRH